jgi:hypothetical protein
VEEGCTNHALFDFTCSCHASPEHFQQCAEFLPLRNRGLGPLAVTVLTISLARRAAATACATARVATGIPGTSRSRLGKLARTARALVFGVGGGFQIERQCDPGDGGSDLLEHL